jgi:hypothetical protein
MDFTQNMKFRFEDELTEATERSLIGYPKSLLDNREKLNRRCCKTWKLNAYSKEQLIGQIPKLSNEIISHTGWNKMSKTLSAKTRNLLRYADYTEIIFQKEMEIVLDASKPLTLL